jgi:flagellar biosynthesis protein FlhF
MRLRSFTGRTMSEAMGQVREHLGPEAIIVSTQEDETGDMCVTAALDLADIEAAEPHSDVIDALGEVLAAHGLSPERIDRILTATLPYHAQEPVAALSSALAAVFAFKPLAVEKQRPLILVGPPGAGKTVTIAKLAARHVMTGEPVRLVSADTLRAGGVDQLDAFAKILKLPLAIAHDARDLATLVSGGPRTLIDSPGINPWSAGDRRDLRALISASDAEPILVLGAGGDTVDVAEMAGIFRELGCARLIVTRLDMVRRLGSILTAADGLHLTFAEAGISGDIADGITPFTPVLLARLLLSSVRQPLLAKKGDP